MADSKNQCLRSARSYARQRPFLTRTALTLALGPLLAACAERLEIGQLGSEPQPPSEPSGVSSFVDTLLASDVSDGDVLLDQELSFGAAVGDVDGDGYDDWVTAADQLIYGGPRATNGLLRIPVDAPQFSWSGDPWDNGLPGIAPAGDVNGDGFGDLLFSSGTPSYEWWDNTDLDHTSASCAGLRAYLWYGRAERPFGRQDLAVTAVPFQYSEELATQLRQDSSAPSDSVECELTLTPAGDLDGDGFADLFLSSRFEYQISNADPAEVINRARGNALLLYGRSARIESAAEASSSSAKIAGAQSLLALGDVDGDGYDDLLVTPASSSTGASTRWSWEGAPALRLFAGSAERLQGEIAVEQSGVPLTGFGPDRGQGIRVGDLDADGFRDFLVQAQAYSSFSPGGIGDNLYYVFYGGPERTRAPLQAEQADAIIRIPGGLGVVHGAGDWQGDGFDDLSLALAIHPGTEALFRARDDLSPEQRELKGRSLDSEFVELHLLSGGHTRMSGTYAPAVFRPELTPPITRIETAPLRHLYPGGSVGDFDGDGRADLNFSVSSLGAPPSSSLIKYGAPPPPSTRPLH